MNHIPRAPLAVSRDVRCSSWAPLAINNENIPIKFIPLFSKKSELRLILKKIEFLKILRFNFGNFKNSFYSIRRLDLLRHSV